MFLHFNVVIGEKYDYDPHNLQLKIQRENYSTCTSKEIHNVIKWGTKLQDGFNLGFECAQNT